MNWWSPTFSGTICEPVLNKIAKIVRWCCTRLKNRPPDTFKTVGFPAKVYLCTLCQYFISNFPLQCCLSCIWRTLTRLWTVDQLFLHYAGHCFVQCWSKQTKTTLSRLFSYKNMPVPSGTILHK